MNEYMITLKEYADLHKITLATCRQRAGRGAFKTVEKVGRDWWIDKREKLVDHRKTK
ncbi:MAG: hypothetical protein PHE09_18980 [Oscillospiraceae bacterium]|nr:hypothetical protein [Oscillospiraceae bacterium]